MRRTLLFLLAVVMLAGAAVFPASAEKTTITMLSTSGPTLDAIEAVAAEIEEKLGIALEVELRPDGPEGVNFVRARLAAGEMADLCLFNSGALLSTLNPAENFVDLTDMPYMDTFSETYKETVTVDGRIYGVPIGSSSAGGWLYNKKVYEELGLTVPHTWAELMENCEKVKEAGKVAVIASFSNLWTSQLILLGDFYNVQQANPNFAADYNVNKAKYATDPAAFRAFEKMREVRDRGFFNEDYNTNTYDYALQMLVEGTGVHYPMLTSALTNIYKNYGCEAVDNIGVFGQPGDDAENHGLTVWLPSSFYVYKKNDNVDAALEWINYYLSPEARKIFSSHVLPDGPYVIDGAELPDDAYAGVKEMVPYFEQGRTSPALEFLTAVKGPNSAALCVETMGGTRGAEECAELYDADIEKQAKQLGLPGWE